MVLVGCYLQGLSLLGCFAMATFKNKISVSFVNAVFPQLLPTRGHN